MLSEIDMKDNEIAQTAYSIGDLLKDHRADDVLVLDLRQMNIWTDFFIIATTTSNAHMDGLERHIKEFCLERNIEIIRKSPKPKAENDEWRLIDLGVMVIHLMSRQTRNFYELERLWAAPKAQPKAHAAFNKEAPSHSSNSS
jgi:ribosome-associated protein